MKDSVYILVISTDKDIVRVQMDKAPARAFAGWLVIDKGCLVRGRAVKEILTLSPHERAVGEKLVNEFSLFKREKP